ncbi:PREDICTED: leucine-rich repeat flightless-interacting protein 1 isoform X6 [Myotis brandtii]|uniref:leucine-rich repeat flightless-interacting protein 1 isoform X6 n=1 Tax=Myotis brandtii TaxID=109478 RepID=UPI0003BBE3E1|nr:PREDICTED: leucine-rich repeat flightless-interacting protein 1 isoform X6 [Myotis brandtii]
MTNPAATQNKEIDCLSPEAQRLAEARLAAKRAARAEAREIRMKELERQQKEIYQVQKKYYGLYTKWGDIEQWMEDSERCSRRSRRNTSASDEDERVSVGSRGSLRSQPDLESGGPYGWTNGYDGELYGSQPLSRRSGRNSTYSGDGRSSTVSSSREEKLGPSCSDLGLPRGGLAPQVLFAQSGSRPSEHSGHLNSSSRASSRASSARASPVVEERPEKDFTEKGSRNLPGLSAATLASLGGTSSRRGSGDTSISIDTEASIREIKELSELKDQIQDVEGKYMQGLKQMKDSLAEVEEKYKKAMVSNAQLDNEKMNYMYQVDTLKDTLLELEEQLAESRRQYEEKSKEFEREKHTHSLLQFQFAQVKAALQQREEMLEEIRQLQQKQASYIREISDLQETIEWKDKKIGALERQKEFFDSIRSERDDLREEVVVLKEELKKHGIILNSETATNGETSDTLNSVGYPGPTKMTKEELNALKVTGDGTLGKATAVEVKNEIVENVGKREILQNTEQEQHKEDPVEDCVDTEALPPGGSAEDRKTSEDSAPSLGTIATNEGQVRSPVLESTSFLEHAEQVESRELTSTPDARTGAPLEQSKSSSEPDGETLGPATGQGSQNAVDVKNQSEEAAEKQEQEEQDVQTSLGEVSTKPHQESAPVQIPEVEKVSSSQGAVEAGLAGLEEQAGTVASRPPRYSDDTGSHDTCAVDVPTELGPGLEKELTNQEGAEPREVQVPSTGAGGEHSEEEDEGRGFLSEKPVQTEVPASPSSPAARAQEAAGAHTVKAKREPSEEKNDPQGEGLGSSQKKTKNKKKKNKKKKSPAPVETPKDVKKELTFQNPDLSEAEEEKQVKSPDENSGVETQNEVTGNPNEVTGNPKQSIVAGSGDNLGFPEDPQVELAGKLNHEDGHVNAEAGKGRADGELFEGDTIQASGCRARAEGSEEGAVKADAEGAGTAPSRPPENEDLPSSARLGNGSPSEDINAASQTEGTEGCVMSEGPSQGVRKVLGSASLENDDLAPARESGDSHSERKEETRGRSEKDKSKEDCALS